MDGELACSSQAAAWIVIVYLAVCTDKHRFHPIDSTVQLLHKVRIHTSMHIVYTHVYKMNPVRPDKPMESISSQFPTQVLNYQF